MRRSRRGRRMSNALQIEVLASDSEDDEAVLTFAKSLKHVGGLRKSLHRTYTHSNCLYDIP